MSNYEGMHGKGIVKKTDLREPKAKLIESHNLQIARLSEKELKQLGTKVATVRTNEFPILSQVKEHFYPEGYITINLKEGSFLFEIHEGNHSVDRANETSYAFKNLKRFMEKMDTTGSKYGAETYYWSEYDEDENGFKTPGTTTKYGAWMETWQKDLKKKRAI